MTLPPETLANCVTLLSSAAALAQNRTPANHITGEGFPNPAPVVVPPAVVPRFAYMTNQAAHNVTTFGVGATFVSSTATTDDAVYTVVKSVSSRWGVAAVAAFQAASFASSSASSRRRRSTSCSRSDTSRSKTC